MENKDNDVIYVSSDSDNDSDILMYNNNRDETASEKAWNMMYEVEEDEDPSATKKGGSEYTDDEDDNSMKTEESETGSGFELGPVSIEDIHAAMEWAEKHTSDIEELLHARLKPFLKNKTIIQIQMYGLAELDLTCQEHGPLQLSIALKLMNRLKKKFPGITMTSQEPEHVEDEMQYIRSHGIQVLETEEFTSEHFIQALKSAENIQNPAFICYMIHGMNYMYGRFLDTHWKPELLSRIIIVGNEPVWYANSDDVPVKNRSKLKEFAKLCDIKSMQLDEESLARKCFGDACIYSISKENAKLLINKFPHDSSTNDMDV